MRDIYIGGGRSLVIKPAVEIPYGGRVRLSGPALFSLPTGKTARVEEDEAVDLTGIPFVYSQTVRNTGVPQIPRFVIDPIDPTTR